METSALQQLTAETCTSMRGRLWPNKLGFNMPGGWQVCFSERAGQWFAGRRLEAQHKRRYAYAPTAPVALAWARTPGKYTEEDD